MSRFFIKPSEIKNGSVALSAEESRHAAQVLRLKSGDVVNLFDGEGGEYRGIVIGIHQGIVTVSLDKSRTRQLDMPKITLAVAVIKPERMDLLLQKASELGVAVIAPLMTDRTVVRLSKERWESKHERWQKIVKEACKQCGQPRIPTIAPVQTLSRFLEGIADDSLILLPTLATSTLPLGEVLARSKNENVTILIGPEGDFTPEEAGLAMKKKAVPVTLGPLVMRTETAALYTLSVVMFYLRELSKTKY